MTGGVVDIPVEADKERGVAREGEGAFATHGDGVEESQWREEVGEATLDVEFADGTGLD